MKNNGIFRYFLVKSRPQDGLFSYTLDVRKYCPQTYTVYTTFRSFRFRAIYENCVTIVVSSLAATKENNTIERNRALLN